jgi:glyoxylase-like metal-dependent hydrolase (beta-lactamase superfamily II)
MRALAVHPDVIVLISRVWQTTCTAVRAGDEGFVIDSPVDPEELDALPGLLAQTGFPVSGLLATHADWDHLLGRLTFPGASLGCGESTGARLADEPGEAQRALRSFDEEQYIEGRPPLALGSIQTLPVPGRLSVGAEREIELHPAEGHTADGTAFWLTWTQVLACGDYLSPVEIPEISTGGSLDSYVCNAGAAAPPGRAGRDRRARARNPAEPRAGAGGARGGPRLPGGGAARRRRGRPACGPANGDSAAAARRQRGTGPRYLIPSLW